MEFVLLGFDQSASARQFRFECIGPNHSRTPVAVVADLCLAHQHNIQLQTLPLLCRDLLEHSDPVALAAGVITLTEAHMAALSKAARDATEEKKQRRLRPVISSNVGKAWRTPQAFAATAKLP